MASTNGNSPSSSRHKEDESLENKALIEGNLCGHVKKESAFNTHPVAPFTSGEGLPYAPEGWPNPGDVWGWRVGARTNKSGYFVDRCLFLPKSLLPDSSKRVSFLSKCGVEHYVKTKFPNMEIEAFFALFSWKVPSTKLSPAIVKSLENGKDVTEGIVYEKKLKRKAKLSNQRTRKSLRRIHVRSDIPPAACDANDIIDLAPLSEEEPLNATVAENFDDYLNTLEDILVLPPTETALSDPVVPATANQDNEITECRKKLSSLLALDFPSLISSNKVAEAAKLASQLRRDPSISVDQLINLKMVEEMLLLSEAFLEAKRNMEEADKFCDELEAKKLKVPCLKKEYTELKDKIAQTEADIETTSKAMKEIEDQILRFESKRKEMSTALETMQKTKAELISSQTMIANSIPSIVSEIQHGNSVKTKWELKKANCAQRKAEIQERFSSLRGLTF